LRWDNNQPEVGCKSRKQNEFRKEKDENRVPAQGAVGLPTNRKMAFYPFGGEGDEYL